MDVEDLESDLEAAREEIEELRREVTERDDKISEVRGVLKDMALTIRDALRALDTRPEQSAWSNGRRR